MHLRVASRCLRGEKNRCYATNLRGLRICRALRQSAVIVCVAVNQYSYTTSCAPIKVKRPNTNTYDCIFLRKHFWLMHLLRQLDPCEHLNPKHVVSAQRLVICGTKESRGMMLSKKTRLPMIVISAISPRSVYVQDWHRVIANTDWRFE